MPDTDQPSKNSGVRIIGSYTYINSGKTNTFNFVASILTDSWFLASTNKSDIKDWTRMNYDGTNIYTFATDDSVIEHNTTVTKYEVYGYVYPGSMYIPHNQDSVRIFFPWLVFCLSPQATTNYEHDGMIEIPWPWGAPRDSLGNYGYKWLVNLFPNGQVIQQIDVVRDTSLDLKTEEDELHRPTLDYPFSISDREEMLKYLMYRKNMPNGFIRCNYKCTELYQTNGYSIPVSAQFSMCYPNQKDRILDAFALKATKVELLQNAENIDSPDLVAPGKTTFMDYRYEATNKTTRFNYALYGLESGDRLKSDKDPILLAEAKRWLKHGPRFNTYEIRRKLILTGILTVSIGSSILLIFFSIKRKKQH